MTQNLRPFVAIFGLAATVFLWMSVGCGRQEQRLPGDDSTGGAGAPTLGDDAAAAARRARAALRAPGFSGPTGGFSADNDGGFAPVCPAGSPLSCFVDMKCANGAKTTLTGKVLDPAGKNPIYNVVVFVPNDPNTLPPITPGTNSCSACDTSVGDYVTATLTDHNGAFTLKGVPTGKNVPLVIQIGKWRRTLTIPSIADCKTTTAAEHRSPSEKPARRRHAPDGPPHGRPRRPRLLPDQGGHRPEGVFRSRRRRAARHLPGPGRPGPRRRSRQRRPVSRMVRRATARTRAALSGRARPASRSTTSSFSRARAIPSIRTRTPTAVDRVSRCSGALRRRT